MCFSPHTMHTNATRRHDKTMLPKSATIRNKCPCDWRRAIFSQASPASAQSRLDFTPHPFYPPGEQLRTITTQRGTEGMAGSPLQADRKTLLVLLPSMPLTLHYGYTMSHRR